MGIKKFKPVTPTLRFKTTVTSDELTVSKPHKPLTSGKKQYAGRGSGGRISVRRRGGGHKRRYRVIDFKRNKYNIEGTVTTIEYDPNRSAYIALITYNDGEKRYIIAPDRLRVGDTVVSGENVDIKVGNALPLRRIPPGTSIHNIELQRGRGGQLGRSAGS